VANDGFQTGERTISSLQRQTSAKAKLGGEKMLQDFAGLTEQGSREEKLLHQIDFTRLPRHIAVIMDGNGRWANRRLLPRVAGHRAGVEAVRATVDTCTRLGIEVLTLYAFSVENWKRPPFEIEALMTFLKEYLRKELENIHRENIRFQTIGRTSELDESVQFELRSAIRKTANNTGMTLNVALNYGGRVELVDAFRKLMEKCEREGRSPESLLKTTSPDNFTLLISRIPTCSFAPAVKCASAIFCSGKLPTLKFT